MRASQLRWHSELFIRMRSTLADRIRVGYGSILPLTEDSPVASLSARSSLRIDSAFTEKVRIVRAPSFVSIVRSRLLSEPSTSM